MVKHQSFSAQAESCKPTSINNATHQTGDKPGCQIGTVQGNKPLGHSKIGNQIKRHHAISLISSKRKITSNLAATPNRRLDFYQNSIHNAIQSGHNQLIGITQTDPLLDTNDDPTGNLCKVLPLVRAPCRSVATQSDPMASSCGCKAEAPVSTAAEELQSENNLLLRDVLLSIFADLSKSKQFKRRGDVLWVLLKSGQQIPER